MVKKMKFSYEKYLQWCKDNNQPVYPWAKECKDRKIESWDDGMGITDNGYYVVKKWVEDDE